MTGCVDLAGAALLSCLARDPACLPPQHAHFLPLILSTVRQESAAAPYIIRNEREQQAHRFASWDAAVSYAIAADARGDVLGLGLGQITHRANWRLHTGTEDTPAGRRVAIARLLQPCENLRATASHYAAAYGASVAFNAGAGRIGSPPPASAAYAMRVVAGAATEPLQIAPGSSAAPAAAPPAPEPPASPEPLISTGRTVRGRATTYGQ